jgi:hypothetical protein
MRFSSIEQHSLAQKDYVERLALEPKLNVKDALFVASQLVIQGSARADGFLNSLRAQARHPDVLAFLAKLTKQSDFIQRLKYLSDVKNDPVLVSKLYETDGFFFAKGTQHPAKLLVVFTTMFNNFQISNVAFYALLKEFGVSVLMLKDCSLFNFLHGAADFGTDIPSIAQKVLALAAEHTASEIYVIGFSSGGYASLYASFLLPCAGYLGFSVLTDLSEGSPLYAGKYFIDPVRQNVRHQDHLLNLRALAGTTGNRTPRELFFGEEADIDRAHAANMVGVADLKATMVEKCGHQTVAGLIENGTFADRIRTLLFATKQVVRDF